MKHLLLGLLLAIGGLRGAQAQVALPDSLPTSPGPTNGYPCDMPWFGLQYKAQPIRRFTHLPDSIQRRTLQHLHERLGSALLTRLDFVGGGLVDLPTLRRAEAAEHFSGRRWTAYRYYLCFALRDVASQGQPYQCSLALDSAGNVGSEIQLPDVGAEPAKGTMIGPEQAVVLARQYGVRAFWWGQQDLSTKLAYHKGSDTMIWEVTRSTVRRGRHIKRSADLNAHTGELRNRWTSKKRNVW